MEDVYIYKTPGPKFVALDLTRPYTFISASTVSFTVGGVLTYLLAAYRAWQLLPELAPHYAPLGLYWPLLAVWTPGASGLPALVLRRRQAREGHRRHR